jgi:hypothetical protein
MAELARTMAAAAQALGLDRFNQSSPANEPGRSRDRGFEP